ncbi:hypothetical protein [Burkholderia ambifaria]|uniref:hypothetical protein n=1 Tax=Burkholderia ambifaria TaxID=152480 RepID=UPI001ABB15B0|nr:hypothetical protein [Burkholderia ambifaria]
MSARGDEFVAIWKKLPEDLRNEIAARLAGLQGWVPSLEKFEDLKEGKEIRGTTMNFGPVPGGCPMCGK